MSSIPIDFHPLKRKSSFSTSLLPFESGSKKFSKDDSFALLKNNLSLDA